MKQIFVLFVVFFFILNVSAQKTLSLKDATLGSSSYLKPAMPEQLKWKDARHYVMIKNNNLFQYNAQAKDSVELFSLAVLNMALKEKQIKEQDAFPRFSFINESQIWFQVDKHLVILNLENKSIVTYFTYAEDADLLDFCTGNSMLAYTIKNNLYITGTKGIQQITSDVDLHIINGAAVHRNEFGIEKVHFLVSFRKSACILSYGRNHGGGLSPG